MLLRYVVIQKYVDLNIKKFVNILLKNYIIYFKELKDYIYFFKFL